MRTKWLMVVTVLLMCGQGFAVGILPLSEGDGLQRLARSKHRADYGKLSAHYQNQTDRMICSAYAGAIVMNALRYNTEKAPLVDIPAKFLDQMPTDKEGKKFDPRLRMYTPENFLSPAAQKIKSLSRIYAEPINNDRDPGLQLEQYRRVFEEAHGMKATKLVVGTKETARNKEGAKPLPAAEYKRIVGEMKKNLAEKDNYVIVNFARSELKQPGGGHLSPVAAYDEKSDSFLLLDVNPYGGPIAWVDAKDLVNAMNTFDTEENRGLLFISEK